MIQPGVPDAVPRVRRARVRRPAARSSRPPTLSSRGTDTRATPSTTLPTPSASARARCTGASGAVVPCCGAARTRRNTFRPPPNEPARGVRVDDAPSRVAAAYAPRGRGAPRHAFRRRVHRGPCWCSSTGARRPPRSTSRRSWRTAAGTWSSARTRARRAASPPVPASSLSFGTGDSASGKRGRATPPRHGSTMPSRDAIASASGGRAPDGSERALFRPLAAPLPRAAEDLRARAGRRGSLVGMWRQCGRAPARA